MAAGGNEMANMQRLMGAQQQQSNHSTAMQERLIGAEMQAETMKTQAQMRKIMEDTKTSIVKMARDTTVKRKKMNDGMNKQWLQVLSA